ncbi:hypothetical protein Dimus_031379, partial [Dionaea muscipula]
SSSYTAAGNPSSSEGLSRHNLRREMSVDPLEPQLDDYVDELGDTYIEQVEPTYIEQVEPTDQWTDWRTTLANHMFNEWQHSRNAYD